MKFGWINRFQKVKEGHPYNYIATAYDQLMDHIDYGVWVTYLVTIFKKYGREIRRVVDGGCGTGSLILELEKRGYRVVGFDLSLEMIRIASRKVQSCLWQGDLRNISFAKEWDAFLCLYDTILYLTIEEIEKLLLEVKKILLEGGLFIFDTVTENHVLRYWADYIDKDRGDGWDIMRRSWYDRKRRYQHTEFEIFSTSDKKVYREHHLQQIYRLDELERIAERSGFKIIGKFNGFTLNSASEKSDRVHFVLRQEET